MKIPISYKKNAHQEQFHCDLASKIIHLSAGYSAGKSHALCMKALQLSAINRKVDGGLLCPTFKDFKKDILPLFEKIFEENQIQFKFHRQDHYFIFPWSKKKLWIVSGENKLRGPNWGYALVNEVTLIPLERFREVLARVRDKGAVIPQIATVGTPEGIASPYYEFFIEKPPTDIPVRVVYGNTKDNEYNLDPGFIKMLEATYDKISLDAYLKGLWINMNGNQFYYSYDPDKNENRTIREVKTAPVLVGLDFNVEYMTATLWHRDDDSLLGFGEITLDNNADTKKMGEALIIRGYTPERVKIYPDPAGHHRSTKGQPDHAILREMGFEVIARNIAPRMRERQLNVNNLLDKGRIIINPDTMPRLRKDLQAVEQDPVNMEKIKKIKSLTHASDGMDYLCDIVFPFSSPRQNSEVVKFR
jgi:hypothetical protein